MKKMWTIGVKSMMLLTTFALCKVNAIAQETLRLTSIRR